MLGSKSGIEVKARTLPLRGSMTMAAPRLDGEVRRASSAAAWIFASSVR